MRTALFRNLTLWLAILTLLWSSHGQGYVWCVVTDGSVHLEGPLENHCNSDPPALTLSGHALESSAGGDSCHPCVDLVTSHDPLQQRIPSVCDLDAPPLFSISSPLQWGGGDLVRHLLNNLILEKPPRIATTLLVLRTTVLLI